MSEIEKVFGIDLGTTYSAIAYVNMETGRPEVVPSGADGATTTPSVVYIESPENHVVGKTAKNDAKVNADRTVAFVKREMGKDWTTSVDGIEYRPEAISASILKQLAEDARVHLNVPVKKVIITCPAYFGQKERDATKTAGELAGLEVMRIIDEPIAASLSYGVDSSETKTVLVYDLGGGTFDVTLVKFSPEGKEVVAADGDHQLGGKDWDDALVRDFVNRFTTEFSDANIADDAEAIQELQLMAEEKKKNLSQNAKVRVSIKYGGNTHQFQLSREEFDNLTRSSLERTIDPLHKVLEEGKRKGVDRFDELLLVGGSTRMPQVIDLLKKEFPDKEPKFHDPDLAVAKGAAILANNDAIGVWVTNETGQKLATGEGGVPNPEPITTEQKEKILRMLPGNVKVEMVTNALDKNASRVINVSSKSYGIASLFLYQKIQDAADKGLTAIDSDATPQNGKILRISNLVWKNDRIWTDGRPCLEVSEEYGTSEDSQTSISLDVYENEKTPSEETKTYGIPLSAGRMVSEEGKCVIQGLPDGLPAGTPVQVNFIIDEQNILHVKAVCEGREIAVEINIAGAMTPEQIKEAKSVMMKVKTTNT